MGERTADENNAGQQRGTPDPAAAHGPAHAVTGTGNNEANAHRKRGISEKPWWNGDRGFLFGPWWNCNVQVNLGGIA